MERQNTALGHEMAGMVVGHEIAGGIVVGREFACMVCWRDIVVKTGFAAMVEECVPVESRSRQNRLCALFWNCEVSVMVSRQF